MTASSLLSLIRRAQAGDEHAFETLLREHRGLVRGVANDYFLQGGDRDDLWQEADLGFAKAVRDYDPLAGVFFTTFAQLVVTRQVITAVKTAQRLKHKALNESTRTGLTDGDEEETQIVDLFASPDSADPCNVVIAREELAELSARMRKLTPLERAALVGVSSRSTKFRGQNHSIYGEVAQLFGVDEKAIDNGRQRAKRKLADLIAA